MREVTSSRWCRLVAALLAALTFATSAPKTWAASHREAPLIALDPTADITDVYAFRSWEDLSKVVLIMNVIPSQVPASGPNFFNFDDNVLYAFHLDLNGDGVAMTSTSNSASAPKYVHRSMAFLWRMPASTASLGCHQASPPLTVRAPRGSAYARAIPYVPLTAVER